MPRGDGCLLEPSGRASGRGAGRPGGRGRHPFVRAAGRSAGHARRPRPASRHAGAPAERHGHADPSAAPWCDRARPRYARSRYRKGGRRQRRQPRARARRRRSGQGTAFHGEAGRPRRPGRHHLQDEAGGCRPSVARSRADGGQAPAVPLLTGAGDPHPDVDSDAGQPRHQADLQREDHRAGGASRGHERGARRRAGCGVQR